jgi:hypothetical protein
MGDKMFIKDAALEKGSDIAFSSNDYVERLKNIIMGHTAPFNIALVGKWGVGKSSITNLLKEEFKGKSGYKVYEINAWKYESDSLRKAFLKQLWITLGGKQKDFWQNLKDYVVGKTEINEQDLTVGQSIKMLMPPAISLLVLWGIFLLVTFGLYSLAFLWISRLPPEVTSQSKEIINILPSQVPKSNEFQWAAVIKQFIQTLWVPLLIPPIFAFLQNVTNALKGKKIISGFRITKPVETADEYEELFKEQIEVYKSKHSLFNKLIVIVDDLDRLSPRKVVDALDAIKAFVDVPECIFVVACDESILIRALEGQKTFKEQLGLDGEQYLDKIFQFRVPLPPIIESDMREFTINLVKREAPDLIASCNGKFDELVNEILIHADVSTPRQVKKIINTFAGNLLIAQLREKSGKLQNNLLTSEEGIKILAKLSVLEADYNSFFQKLTTDFSLIEEFIIHYNKNTDFDLLPPNLIQYFRKSNTNQSELIPKWRGLANFLFKTQSIKSENLSPFVYLAQDTLGIQAGDEKQRIILKAMLSGNEKGVLNNTSQLQPVEALLVIQVVRNCLPKDLRNVLKAAYQLYSYLPENEQLTLSDAISAQLYNLSHEPRLGLRYWQIDINNIINVYLTAENKIGAEICLLNLLEICFNKESNWYDQISDEKFNDLISGILVELLKHEDKLTQSIKTKIKEFISVSSDIYKSYPVFNLASVFVEFPGIYNEYFGLPFYNRLTTYMVEDAPDVEWDLLAEAFKAIIKEVPPSELLQLTRPLANLIKLDEDLACYIIDFFGPIAEQITKGDSIAIAHELLATTFSDEATLLKSVNVCCKLSVNIETEKQRDNINKVIISLITKDDGAKECATNLIKSIAAQNSIDQLQKTIDYLVEEVVKTNQLDSIIRTISPFMNEPQRQQVITNILRPITFDNFNPSISSRTIRIIELLVEDKQNHQVIKTTVENEINSFINYWPQKPQYGSEILEIIGLTKKLIDKSRLDQVVNSLLNTGFQQFPDIMIHGLRTIGSEIKESYMVDSVKKVMEKSPNYGDILEALAFLMENKKYITKENQTFSPFIQFTIDCLERSPKEFLNAINVMVGTLNESNLQKLITNVLKLNDDNLNKLKSLALNVINKVFGTNSELKIIKGILTVDNSLRTINFLQELVELRVDKKNEVLKNILQEVKKEDPNVYKNALLLFCGKYKDIIDRELVARLLNFLLRSGDDEEVNTACKIMLEEYPNYTFRASKSLVANELIQSFLEVNSSIKERVILVAKALRMEDAFKNALSRGLITNQDDVELLESMLKKRRVVKGATESR